jgi:hypothetical protein
MIKDILKCVKSSQNICGFASRSQKNLMSIDVTTTQNDASMGVMVISFIILDIGFIMLGNHVFMMQISILFKI